MSAPKRPERESGSSIVPAVGGMRMLVVPGGQRVMASSVPACCLRGGRARATEISSTRSRTSVAMLVSSRLLVASDFKVFARSVIWLVSWTGRGHSQVTTVTGL